VPWPRFETLASRIAVPREHFPGETQFLSTVFLYGVGQRACVASQATQPYLQMSLCLLMADLEAESRPAAWKRTASL
jgi:hypothetical protein